MELLCGLSGIYNVLGKYDDGTFLLLTLQIFKSFLLGQKAYFEQRVEAIRSAREVIHCGIRQHCVNSSRFASICFLEVRQSDSRVICDWRIPPKHTVRRGTRQQPTQSPVT